MPQNTQDPQTAQAAQAVQPKKIAVAGATGRLGSHVARILREQGHDVVAISRSAGIDVVTGEGLADALAGVDIVIDTASTPSPDEQDAIAFFTASARNLHEYGAAAGVERIVSVSIIGIDASEGGYNLAKVAHEKALAGGPLPVQILRAAQFHEFVELLVSWGRQGGTAYVPVMRTQLVACSAVAQALVDLANGPAPAAGSTRMPFPEIAGPREESLAKAARLVFAHRGEAVEVVEVSDPNTPDRKLLESGALLPGADALLAGPAFADWLAAS
ncbi:SDR family oxidoreductase [Yinghuangia soli]|uniref:NAD(P)H-binding protein n=1 Tax=Yinghuangia soli TaxID=2908204 RepID=A0AA41Q1Z4_9ACTN|nr:NAD(P)H-binding protein [Yinghuangia soli]MCF2529281.1 NAD(P)H-binding protein [Yinghuangia soli]